MPSSNPSSFYGNVLAIRQALLATGYDADDILGRAGIDWADYKYGDKRIPAECINKLEEIAVKEVGDPIFGLSCAEYVTPSNYHALGVGLLYSNNLRDFFQRFTRYFTLISTLATVEYEETDSYGRFALTGTYEGYCDEAKAFDYDSFVAVSMKFIRMAVWPDFKPLKVSIAWLPPDSYQQKYHDYFDCEIEFSASESAIYVDKADLETEFPTANTELARQNDTSVTHYLEKTEGADLPSRVYAKIIEFLPSGDCSREKVAQSLNMTASTFHNKLKKTGSSYQDLLDNTRIDLAKQYIGKDGLSMGEAAYLLGFTDCSNFSRAFKRWLNMSPRAYRDSMKGG